jgi:hypothetical protein
MGGSWFDLRLPGWLGSDRRLRDVLRVAIEPEKL